ncbi:MAG: DUF3592 domain-containing protein, partial [Deltaproteobacteria bacterium]
DGNLIQVDTLVIAQGATPDQQPVFQYVLADGEMRKAQMTGQVNPRNYPVGSSHRLRYDPQNPEQLQHLAARWPLVFAWLIGLPGALLFIVTVLLGRLLIRILRAPEPPRSP